MHVAVAGGGIFGQVVSWRLALRGHTVTLIEPVGPGHAGSASGDRSRIVRALYDDPGFSASGHAGLALWARWSEELGVRLVEDIGVIYIDRAGDDAAALAFRTWLDRGVANVRALGAVAEELTPAEARKRWPALSVDDVARVVLEPAGGMGRPSRACRAIAGAGLATGRVCHVTAAAEEVLIKGGAARGLRVVDRGNAARVMEADAVVIAAGYHGAALVEALGGPRLGIRRIPHWGSYWDVPFPGGADLALGKLPAWADLGSALYGFPDDGEGGFKVAWHEPRRASTGEHGPETPGAEELEALRSAAERRFPALAGAICRGVYPCAYDATENEVFRIGPVPSVAGLFFVGGLSGHGYKHAPSLGESVAALVSGEAPLLDLSSYSLPG
ncbi:MAG: FAD-dependent oxidoreductase [Minicystis sp.]